MKDLSVLSFDRDELVDIRDVSIDMALPKHERMEDFVRQIKNPRCYKHGKYVVVSSFTDTGLTLEDRMAGYLASKSASSTGGV